MGEVYLAEDTKLHRHVVLKFLSEALAKDAVSKSRLVREARSASGLNHTNIITIYSIEETTNEVFIVMEYVTGVSLKELIDNHQLNFEKSLQILIAAAQGIDWAHRKGLIHRDIKPSNIMVTETGLVKILDFGLARKIEINNENDTEANTLTALTAYGSLVGTVAYMSPEQCSGELLDARSDIFSFGCTIYEALTGKVAFQAQNLVSTIAKILSAEPIPISSVNPLLPNELNFIIAKTLAKKREDRYQTMEQLVQNLKKIESNSVRAVDPIKIPETRYANSNGVNIAYQIFGNGPIDIVYVPGWITHLELGWEQPLVRNFYERLATMGRVILFDKRGTGLSDQTADLPDLTQRMDDVRAVMDAAGSTRAVIFGMSEGGGMSFLFAATYPERTIALVGFGVFAKRIWDPEYPWAPTPEQRQKGFFDVITEHWGQAEYELPSLAPDLMKDEEFRAWWGRYSRFGASPRSALAMAKMNTPIDIRGILPAINVPTLLLHRVDDMQVHIDEARFISKKIPNAKLVEMPGNAHLIYAGNQKRVLDEVESFLNSLPERKITETLLTTVVTIRVTSKSNLDQSYSKALKTYKGIQHRNNTDLRQAFFDGPTRAVRFGQALAKLGDRIGIHTGECELVNDTLSGTTVNLSSRLSELAEPGQIIVSNMVKDLVTDPTIEFIPFKSIVFEGSKQELSLCILK